MSNQVETLDLDIREYGQDDVSTVILDSPQNDVKKSFFPFGKKIARCGISIGIGVFLAASSATAMPDIWSDERRRRETATLAWVFDLPVGRPISRMQALRIAMQILEAAEIQREEFAAMESMQGIQWEDEE